MGPGSYIQWNIGPALTGSSSSLSLAWSGTNNQLNVSFSSDGKVWGNPTTLNQTSKLAPAITVGTFQ